MQLNIKNVAPFATKEQIDALDSAAAAGLEKLEKGTGAGNDERPPVIELRAVE